MPNCILLGVAVSVMVVMMVMISMLMVASVCITGIRPDIACCQALADGLATELLLEWRITMQEGTCKTFEATVFLPEAARNGRKFVAELAVGATAVALHVERARLTLRSLPSTLQVLYASYAVYDSRIVRFGRSE